MKKNCKNFDDIKSEYCRIPSNKHNVSLRTVVMSFQIRNGQKFLTKLKI